MSEIDQLVAQIAQTPSWDERVALIRRIPEEFGRARHRAVYAALAESVYVPHLQPAYAYVHWRADYELEAMLDAYAEAVDATGGFTAVDVDTLTRALVEHPEILLVLRNVVGYTQPELSESTALLPPDLGYPKVSKGRIASMEAGRPQDEEFARALAETVVRLLDGRLFPADPESPMRRKQNKPDTEGGWETVRRAVTEGVPYSWLPHQRHYGGAFRQLLDATAGQRGDAIEQPVEAMLRHAGIPHIRTGSHNQQQIADRFGLTVRPAPDFVMFDESGTLRAMLESKAANDGGTARDKASRFIALRQEAARLGGIPLFAVLAGLGWQRVNDALGPVVQACDGRVFTPATLDEMLAVAPLPSLRGLLARPEDA